MNLYEYHENPKCLNHVNLAPLRVPLLVWEDRMSEEWYKERDDVWAKDAYFAFKYANNVLKGPFPKGEDAIAKDVEYSYCYASEVLKGPFRKGEEILSRYASYSQPYAEYVLKAPFPKGEEAIAKDARFSYWYAKYVLKGPFPKGEDAIAKSDILKAAYELEFGLNEMLDKNLCTMLLSCAKIRL